jgi:two-component system, LytTR family, response regulator AgrA
LNVIICDDRKENIENILKITKFMFEKNNLECNIKAFTNYEDTLRYIKSLNSYEDCLYILDIDLKQDKNGLMLGREIRNIDEYKGEMIYITAHVYQMHKDKMENESLIFKVGGTVFILKPSDIICVETDKRNKKVIIYTLNEQISVNFTLKEIQKELTDQFVQIHRSIIVNKEHIKRIEQINKDLYVFLTGDIKEIVSKRREKEIKECITL